MKNNIKEFASKYKFPLLGIGIIILAIIIFLIGKSLADPDSGYLKNQVVDGLSFENANLVYSNGISIFTAEVYNESSEVYTLKNISINLTSDNGTVTTLIGYIGEELEKEEGKYIQASIDQDLSSSVKLEYVINK